MTQIQQKYEELCAIPSDINELLPYLKEYAEKCDTITEMGVRHALSTYAFLAANPKKYIGYDLAKTVAHKAMQLGHEAGISCEFHVADVLTVEIEETDLLFLDTFHTKTQLERELKLHADKVRKYILFHDTTTNEWIGQDQMAGRSNDLNCGKGIWYAIQEFLDTHTEWYICFRTTINNGLTVIERK